VWFGRPLWEMEPADADAYFGKVLRTAAKGTRLARSQALKTYFLFRSRTTAKLNPGPLAITDPARPAKATIELQESRNSFR
jgi:hypothetical protein